MECQATDFGIAFHTSKIALVAKAATGLPSNSASTNHSSRPKCRPVLLYVLAVLRTPANDQSRYASCANGLRQTANGELWLITNVQVTVISADGSASSNSVPLPNVFKAPIRTDIVQQVHTGMAKNKRQPYAVSEKAGHQTSAESWGTGMLRRYRTIDSSSQRAETNCNIQVAPSPVSPVSLVVVPTVLVKLRSVTCAAPVACSLPPKCGESGTPRST